MNAPVKIRTVPIDEAAITEAEALGIDVVRACEAGLRKEIRRAADAVWVEQNRTAMEASNRWVEEHGLPGAEYRTF